jgi:perosamine synthetase
MPLEQISSIQMAKPVIGEEEIAEVEAVLRSGFISDGETVRKFEIEFSNFTGTTHAVAVNSGTAAIYIALLAHGIGPGDEVITSPFTFIATANAVLLTGARPVFADIRPDTFNIDTDEVVKKITRRTKALLPVHLYGQSCDMEALIEIAGRCGLAVIEDACQAHGAEYLGKKVGSFGTGCFSFYPTKNMTTGEGGMITTNDADIAARARMIINHGQRERYYHETIGYNFRMTNIAGALGLCQLKKLAYMNDIRIRNAEVLTAGLKDMEGLILPVSCYTRHVFHQYTIRLTQGFRVTRGEFRERLRSHGVITEVYYPRPVHKQPLYENLGYHDRLPVAEKIAGEVVSLPVHPSLSEPDLQYIVESIRGTV